MFSDPMVSLMFMLLLCFVGMLVMFLFVIRSLTTQANTLRDGYARQHKVLEDIERQMMEMSFALRPSQGKGAFQAEGTGGMKDAGEPVWERGIEEHAGRRGSSLDVPQEVPSSGKKRSETPRSGSGSSRSENALAREEELLAFLDAPEGGARSFARGQSAGGRKAPASGRNELDMLFED